MRILPKFNKAFFMFLSNKDLPSYGKAFAWVIVFLFGSISVFVLANALKILVEIV